jgi:hypothetical protein
MLTARRLQATGKIAADCVKGGLNLRRKPLHRRNRSERDQRDNKGVLYQILTFVCAHQVVELQVEAKKHLVHLCLPLMAMQDRYPPLNARIRTSLGQYTLLRRMGTLDSQPRET